MKKPTSYLGIFGGGASRSGQSVTGYGETSVVPFKREHDFNTKLLNLDEGFGMHEDGERFLHEAPVRSSARDLDQPQWYDLLIIGIIGSLSCGLMILGIWKLFDLLS